MDTPPPQKPRPLFSNLSLACVLLGGVLMWASRARIATGETLSGYSGLALTISFMVAILLTGLVTGQIGLIRGEKPAAFPILALLLNGVIFITAVLHIPR